MGRGNGSSPRGCEGLPAVWRTGLFSFLNCNVRIGRAPRKNGINFEGSFSPISFDTKQRSDIERKGHPVSPLFTVHEISRANSTFRAECPESFALALRRSVPLAARKPPRVGQRRPYGYLFKHCAISRGALFPQNLPLSRANENSSTLSSPLFPLVSYLAVYSAIFFCFL